MTRSAIVGAAPRGRPGQAQGPAPTKTATDHPLIDFPSRYRQDSIDEQSVLPGS
jgi:hypothetical protein